MSLRKIYRLSEGAFDYSVSHLSNGLTSIVDRRSGLRGLFNTATGDFVSGDLRLPKSVSKSLTQEGQS